MHSCLACMNLRRSDSVWFWRLCANLNGFVRTLAKRSCVVCTALLESCLHPALQQITKCHLYKIHIITMAICHSQTSPIGQASWIPWKAGDFLHYVLIFFCSWCYTAMFWCGHLSCKNSMNANVPDVRQGYVLFRLVSLHAWMHVCLHA